MKKNESNAELEGFLKRSFSDFFENLPQTIAVSCLQFGDTGKGKFVDLFANWADIIARGTGGDNAGHTVICDGQEKVFHLIPSGIIHDTAGKINVIGSGTVVYPKTLVGEMTLLRSQGLQCDNLKVALNAKLMLPHHIVLDRLGESKAGAAKIGTTGKGIGPCYTDFIARRGLIINDVLNPDIFRKKLEKSLDQAHSMLSFLDHERVKTIMQHEHLENGAYYHEENFFDQEAIIAKYLEYGEFLRPFIQDTDTFMRNSVGKKKILLEGAQGYLLSIDHGTYPYVTASDCSAAGLAKGVGLKSEDIDVSFGIVKGFYSTRVGKGPFPTEMGDGHSEKWCNGGEADCETEDEFFPDVDINDDHPFRQGIAIRRVGQEYGATTGRPRRVGWLDLPLLRHALVSGADNIILTKLDVLTGIKKIKVCYAYKYIGPDYQYGETLIKKGEILRTAIVMPGILENCVSLYKEFPGWKNDIRKTKYYSNLPDNLKKIIKFIFHEIEATPRIISVGPASGETIFIEHFN